MSKYIKSNSKCKYEAYDKNEINNLLNAKANTSDVYIKSEVYNKTDSDNKYQPKVLSGTSNPSSSLGNNGDIYFQYSS